METSARSSLLNITLLAVAVMNTKQVWLPAQELYKGEAQYAIIAQEGAHQAPHIAKQLMEITESFFFNGVATANLSIHQQITPHPCSGKQSKLNSVVHFKKAKIKT